MIPCLFSAQMEKARLRDKQVVVYAPAIETNFS